MISGRSLYFQVEDNFFFFCVTMKNITSTSQGQRKLLNKHQDWIKHGRELDLGK